MSKGLQGLFVLTICVKVKRNEVKFKKKLDLLLSLVFLA